MNSNINEVTESIGKKVVVITNNLHEIRELLKELEQPENNTNKPIEEERSIQESNLDNNLVNNLDYTDEDYLLEREGIDMNAGVVNEGNAGLVNEGNAGVVSDSKLEIPKSDNFDSSKPYTKDDIKLYRDVASNSTKSQSMSIQNKYDIIVNAEKRHDYLKTKIKTSVEEEEFQKLDEIFQHCHEKPDKHCIKIENMWKDAESRENDRLNIPQSGNQVQAWSSPRLSSGQLIEKAEGFVQNEVQRIDRRKWVPPISSNNTKQKGGKKRRSTMKRGKQNKKSQKKSKSHKKRH